MDKVFIYSPFRKRFRVREIASYLSMRILFAYVRLCDQGCFVTSAAQIADIKLHHRKPKISCKKKYPTGVSSLKIYPCRVLNFSFRQHAAACNGAGLSLFFLNNFYFPFLRQFLDPFLVCFAKFFVNHKLFRYTISLMYVLIFFS